MARVLVLAALLASCVDPLTTHATSSPEWELKNVRGYAETVVGPAPDTAYGWSFAIDGDVAHWFECASPDECGGIRRERPRAEVLGIERVGHAAVGDAGAVDVVKLSLAPGRKYVVPYDKPGTRAGR
jgi:hypothetical protein